MKIKERALSVLLSLVMVLTFMPMLTFAEEGSEFSDTDSTPAVEEPTNEEAVVEEPVAEEPAEETKVEEPAKGDSSDEQSYIVDYADASVSFYKADGNPLTWDADNSEFNIQDGDAIVVSYNNTEDVLTFDYYDSEYEVYVFEGDDNAWARVFFDEGKSAALVYGSKSAADAENWNHYIYDFDECYIPVTIDTSVQSISFEPATITVFAEDVIDGTEDGEDYYDFWNRSTHNHNESSWKSPFAVGDTLTVNYKDGTTEVYKDQDYYDEDDQEYDDMFFCGDESIWPSIDDDPLEPGNNIITISYKGVSTTINVFMIADSDDEPDFGDLPDEDDIEDIELNNKIDVEVTNDAPVVTFRFAPERSGFYIFESFGGVDAVGQVRTADEVIRTGDDIDYPNDDQYLENDCNFRVGFYAETGTTYYLQAMSYDPGDASFQVKAYDVEWIAYATDENWIDFTGEPITLEVFIEGAFNGTIKWYRNRSLINGNGDSTIEVSDKGEYYCEVSDGNRTEKLFFFIGDEWDEPDDVETLTYQAVYYGNPSFDFNEYDEAILYPYADETNYLDYILVTTTEGETVRCDFANEVSEDGYIKLYDENGNEVEYYVYVEDATAYIQLSQFIGEGTYWEATAEIKNADIYNDVVSIAFKPSTITLYSEDIKRTTSEGYEYYSLRKRAVHSQSNDTWESEFALGDQVIVYYDNGRTKTFTNKDYFDDGEGDWWDGFFNENDTESIFVEMSAETEGKSDELKVGNNKVKVYYHGRSATIDVQVETPESRAAAAAAIEAAARAAAAAAIEAARQGTPGSLPGVKASKPKAAKKAITVKWKKLNKKQLKSGVSNIEVWVCSDGAFASGSTIEKVVGKKKSSVKIKGLQKGVTYYAKARAITYSGGAKIVGPWSAVKTVKVKK